MERETSVELWGLFQQACSLTESDIHEHLPVLRKLAEQCDHVTEFGLRWANGSTVAFLAAQPTVLVSWDLNPYHVVSQQVLNLMQLAGRTSFQPRVGDSTQVNIEGTDLLFIDTLHTARQLQAELRRHAFVECNKVRRFLVFHDVETFGHFGEDGNEGGLMDAIRWFHKNNFPLWRPVHHSTRNNGLLILQREADFEENGLPELV
jgi:hypothetical protein